MDNDTFYRQLGGFAFMTHKITRQLKDLYTEALLLNNNASSEELDKASTKLDSLCAIVYPLSLAISKVKMEIAETRNSNQSDWQIPSAQLNSNETTYTPSRLVELVRSDCSNSSVHTDLSPAKSPA